MARRFSGRSVTVAELGAGVLLLLAQSAFAAEAPVGGSSGGKAVLVSPEAEAPYQVSREDQQQVRWLDPAVFTEISPLTVPEVALKLPEDQQE